MVRRASGRRVRRRLLTRAHERVVHLLRPRPRDRPLQPGRAGAVEIIRLAPAAASACSTSASGADRSRPGSVRRRKPLVDTIAPRHPARWGGAARPAHRRPPQDLLLQRGDERLLGPPGGWPGGLACTRATSAHPRRRRRFMRSPASRPSAFRENDQRRRARRAAGRRPAHRPHRRRRRRHQHQNVSRRGDGLCGGRHGRRRGAREHAFVGGLPVPQGTCPAPLPTPRIALEGGAGGQQVQAARGITVQHVDEARLPRTTSPAPSASSPLARGGAGVGEHAARLARDLPGQA